MLAQVVEELAQVVEELAKLEDNTQPTLFRLVQVPELLAQVVLDVLSQVVERIAQVPNLL